MTTPTPVPMTTPKPKARRRRWLLRLALAAVIARLLLAVFLPQVVAFAASFAGLEVTMRGASLSLFGLSFHADDLVARDAQDRSAPPLLQAQELVVDLSAMHLFAGDLVFVDVSLAGGRIALQNRPDGSLRLPASWQTGDATASGNVAAEATKTPSNFQLPLSISSLRLHDLVVQFQDVTSLPPTTVAAEVDVEVSDLGRVDRPGSILVRAHQPDWLDTAWLRAEVTASATRLDVSFEVGVRGVHTARLPYATTLQSLGRDAPVLDADLGGTLRGSVRSTGQPELSTVLRGSVRSNDEDRLHATLAIGPNQDDIGGSTWPMTAELRAPGIVERVHVRSCQFAIGQSVDLRGAIEVDGLSLQRLPAGWMPTTLQMPAGGLDTKFAFDATLGDDTTATVRDLEVRSGDERVTLRQLAVQRLRFDATGLRLERLQFADGNIGLTQHADGSFGCAGVRFTAGPPTTPAATAATPRPAAWPTIQVAHLDGTGLRGSWRDERKAAALPIELQRLQGTGLAFGTQAPPGTLSLQVHVPDAVDSLAADLTLQSTPPDFTVEARLRGEGITAAALRPWLAPHNIEPTLRAATLQGLAAATLARRDDGISIDGKLANLRLQDGDDVLLSVRSVLGTQMQLAGDATKFGDWRVADPFLAVHRDDSGFRLGGLHFAANSAPRAADATPAPDSATPSSSLPPRPLQHGELAIERAVVRWSQPDHAPLALGFDATVGRVAADSAPTPFQATLRLDGALRAATVQGTIAWAPDLRIAAVADVEGMHGNGLDRFLPASMRCTLIDGTLQAKAEAHFSATTARVALRDLSLHDRGEELAAASVAEVQIARPDADHVHCTGLRMQGVRAVLASTPEGLHVPGLRLAASAGEPAPAGTPAVASPDLRLPWVSIDGGLFEFERVVWRDRRTGEGEPVVLTGRVTLAPFANAPEADPATAQVQATFQLPPLCAFGSADVRLQPYALAPTLTATITAKGLDPSAIGRVVPSLAPQVQAATTATELHAELHARLDLGRRDPCVLHPDRPLAGELTGDRIVLRDTASGEDLVRIGSFDVTARAIDLRTGSILLRSIELDDPFLRARATPGGLEIAGLRLPPSPPVPTDASTANVAASPPPEFAVDRFTLNGLAIDWRDQTTEPATHLPIAAGDVTIQGLHLGATPGAANRPITFSATVHGGEVALEQRIVRSSMLAGVLGSTVAAIAGTDDRHRLEPRPFVDAIEVQGHLLPSQPLRGQVRVDLTGFELAALRGLAKQGGIDITDGLFDQSLRIDLRGHDGIHIGARQVFTFLSLTEPPGGPISTYLRLPAPLDSVLFLLRNEDDEHRLPVQLHVPAGGLSAASVRETIAEAVLRIVAAAVAGSAERTAGVLTGALGLSGDAALPAPATLPFAAGDPLPLAALPGTIVDALRDDPQLELLLVHELGAGDLARATALANPGPDRIEPEVERLRRSRRELQRQRLPLAERCEALFLAGQLHEARAAQLELQANDRRLGELEGSLDAMLGMLAGDSPRAARRRTTAAAAELAASRLAAVRAQVLALPGLDASRVVARSPRGVPTVGIAEGGRVIATLRRRRSQ